MSSIIKSRNFVIKENEPLVLGTHFNLVDGNGNKIDEEGALAVANVPGLSKDESKKIALLAEIVALESDLEKSKKLYQGVTNEIEKAKENAAIEIEKIKEDAYNVAYENGYNEGLTKGSAELHAEVDELKAIMEKAFKDDKARFETETEEKTNDFLKEAKSVMKSIILTSVNQVLKDDLKDENLVETLILRGMLELKDEKKVTIYYQKKILTALIKKKF